MDGKLSVFRNSRLYSYVHDLEHLFHNFFKIYTVQCRRSQHARTLTPTRMQTLPLWAPPKDWAPADLEILEVTTGASSSTGTSLPLNA
jgi:hypothetical protein